MKKLIAFIFVTIIFLGLAYIKTEIPRQLDFEKAVVVSSCKLDVDGQEIKNGEEYYYTFNAKSFKKLSLSYGNIKGVVYYINKNYNLSYFNEKFDYCSYRGRDVDEREIYYGYDKSYNDYRMVDNKKINFQLVRDDNYWILGYPMILTGF